MTEEPRIGGTARSLIYRVAFVMAALSTLMLVNYVWIVYLGWNLFGGNPPDDPSMLIDWVDAPRVIDDLRPSYLYFPSGGLSAIVGVSVMIWLVARRALNSSSVDRGA